LISKHGLFKGRDQLLQLILNAIKIRSWWYGLENNTKLIQHQLLLFMGAWSV